MSPEFDEEELEAARLQLMEALGRQSEFWGLGKAVGEQYAVLYLSKEPMSLGELAGAMGVTKGSVSTSIRFLEQLGMVRRLRRPGDRRVYFEVEDDFWEVTRRLLERRQKPEFDISFQQVDQSLELAREAPEGREKAFAVERLEALTRFYDELDGIVETVLWLGPERLARLVELGARALRGGRRRENEPGRDGS